MPSEGLMAGQSFQDEIADKIKRCCKKTIIILSPDYIDCSWCNYEARLAHLKNPGKINIPYLVYVHSQNTLGSIRHSCSLCHLA